MSSIETIVRQYGKVSALKVTAKLTTNPQSWNYNHWLFTQLSRCLLHSSIPELSSNQRVADIGAGTGFAISELYLDQSDLHKWQPATSSFLYCPADQSGETRICLIELSRCLHDTVLLDGFDISPAQYPARAWLPNNINLHTHNAFAPFPQELLEAYNVINLRFLVTVLDRAKLDTLLGNLTALLSTKTSPLLC